MLTSIYFLFLIEQLVVADRYLYGKMLDDFSDYSEQRKIYILLEPSRMDTNKIQSTLDIFKSKHRWDFVQAIFPHNTSSILKAITRTEGPRLIISMADARLTALVANNVSFPLIKK